MSTDRSSHGSISEDGQGPAVPPTDDSRGRGASRADGLPGRGHRLDALGAALLAALVAWLWISAQLAGGDPAPAQALLAGAGLAYAASRLVSARLPHAVPLICVAGAAIVAVASGAGTVDRLRGPIGYGNATAAFFVLAAAAAAVLAVRLPGRALRGAALVVGAGFAAVPFLNRSVTGAGLAAVAAIAGLVGRQSPQLRRRLCAAAPVAVLAVLAATVLLAAQPSIARSTPELLETTITSRRVVLWREALALMGDEPLAGVGAQGFRFASATARADPDASWAHHEYLQLGAETGVPGLMLGLALVGWLIARLARDADDPGAAIACAGVTALAIHACIDYVLHFPSVVLLAAALAGVGVRAPARAQPQRVDRARAWASQFTRRAAPENHGQDRENLGSHRPPR